MMMASRAEAYASASAYSGYYYPQQQYCAPQQQSYCYPQQYRHYYPQQQQQHWFSHVPGFNYFQQMMQQWQQFLYAPQTHYTDNRRYDIDNSVRNNIYNDNRVYNNYYIQNNAYAHGGTPPHKPPTTPPTPEKPPTTPPTTPPTHKPEERRQGAAYFGDPYVRSMTDNGQQGNTFHTTLRNGQRVNLIGDRSDGTNLAITGGPTQGIANIHYDRTNGNDFYYYAHDPNGRYAPGTVRYGNTTYTPEQLRQYTAQNPYTSGDFRMYYDPNGGWVNFSTDEYSHRARLERYRSSGPYHANLETYAPSTSTTDAYGDRLPGEQSLHYNTYVDALRGRGYGS
jgi:hypothetical protein